MNRARQGRSHGSLPWLTLLGIGMLAAAAIALQTTGLSGPPCLFHGLTGWPCPGCGTTRGVQALMRGDIAAAFRLNPLAIAALIGFTGWAVARVGHDLHLWTFKPPAPPVSRYLPVAIVAVVLNWAYLLSIAR